MRRQRSSAAAEDPSRHHQLGTRRRQRSSAAAEDPSRHHQLGTRRRQRSSAAAEDQSRHHHNHHLGTNSCRDQMKTTAISAASSRHLSLPRPNEAHGFNQLQTRLWRPGEYLLQPEASHISPSCILSHWIRRIQPWPFKLQHFPYPAPRAFTVGAINVQRLYSDRVELKETSSRLTSHGFIKLISRYKAPSKFPCLVKQSSLQRLDYQDHISLIICFFL